MKLTSSLSCLALGAAFALSQPAVAGDLFRVVKHPVARVYIPEGYDRDDSIQIVVEGQFPNSCFQLGRTTASLNGEDQVDVTLEAYEYLGVECSDYPAPFHAMVPVGLLGRSGNYRVNDKTSGKVLGVLKVKEPEASEAGTDSAAYASLLDANLTTVNAEPTLRLHGVLTSSCLRIQKVTVIPQPERNCVVVLPVIEKTPGSECTPGEYPFHYDHPVKETLPQKKFLLHVRSMGGQAINTLIARP